MGRIQTSKRKCTENGDIGLGRLSLGKELPTQAGGSESGWPVAIAACTCNPIAGELEMGRFLGLTVQ